MDMPRLRVAIACFPTYGGSGIVATELGLALAERGHRVHVLSFDLPVRLDRYAQNVVFHEVAAREYPLLPQSQYTLALASKLVDLANFEGIDVMHVHYAVPHAASAYLARQVLGPGAPKVVCTLHGTDITLVGSDPSYLPITRFAIGAADAVTTPSESLRESTYSKLSLDRSVPIEVIANFVDTERYAPATGLRRACVEHAVRATTGRILGPDALVLMHVSNFRPVKRVSDTLLVLERVLQHRDAVLVLVGDGPERSRVERLARERGLAQRVCFVGKATSFATLLAGADVFLLPSESESFGLAALEALACGVPVVATNVGGLPEVVVHGECGFLCELGDTDAMARGVLALTSSPERWARASSAARHIAESRFRKEPVVDAYESLFYRLTQG
jgi:N-acetyl-alpha-D-glucosaminyl L-malate synthase BshA